MASNKNQAQEFVLYEQYIKEIKKYPLVSKKEEVQLLEEIKTGSKSAFNRLIEANLRFVVKVAFLYRGQGLPLMDLINEGNIGLMEAARRYDLTSKVRFISYAVWWIRQSITRALYEKSRLVRIPSSNELKIRQLARQRPKSQQVTGGRENEVNLGKSLGLTGAETDKLISMSHRHVSLDDPLHVDGDSTYADRLVDTTPNPFETTAQNSVDEFINHSLENLDPRERKVLSFYYGLGEQAELSLREIGDHMGISKERVRQLKISALEKLKDQTIERELLLAA